MTPAYDRNNIFAKILRGEAPCAKVYEDEYALAFKDIYPKAQVHVLAIPKGEYVSLTDFSQSAPPDMIRASGVPSPRWPSSWASPSGYRIGSNVGPGGGQVVFHFHVHILSGPRQ